MGVSSTCEEFTPLRAEIVSVGTELLMGQIVDTNAAYMARGLAEVGISIYRRTTVGDNMERLVTALKEAFSDSDVVITIGGLGPTMDDITREGLATALGDTLVQDEQIAEGLRAFFTKRNMPVLESNLRQAMVPVHGRAIPNPNGTAPGVLFEKDGKIGIALPGPPNEFIPMTDNHVLPYLRQKTGNIGTIRSLVLRVAGVGESAAEDRIKDLMMDANPSVAPYAKVGEVHLRVTAKAETAELAEQMIAERAKRVRNASATPSTVRTTIPWRKRSSTCSGSAARPSARRRAAPAAWWPSASPTSPAALRSSSAAWSPTATPPRPISSPFLPN